MAYTIVGYGRAMARRPRNGLPDFGVFHVTARGTGSAPIYADDADRQGFLGLFARTCTQFEWRCHAYCLMTTHYHLIVEAELCMLSRGMARLNGVYAQAFNNRHRRFGHLFADRFSSYVIESEKHFEAASRYVLDNPVRAGLCTEWQAWRWSGVTLPEQTSSVERRGTVPGRSGTVPAVNGRARSGR